MNQRASDAHQRFKTPLKRMRLRTEMMSGPQLQGQCRTDVDDMRQLLDGNLDFLRGKALDETMQPVDLIAPVESLVEDYEGMGDVSLQAPESLQWPCRPRALKRALINLIDNALKYGEQAQVVVIHDAQGVEIQVRDNGPGLPEHELQNVYEPFYRIQPSRSRDTGGAGLGLAIVRQIARSHGSDVELSNLQGGGLIARLYLREPPVANGLNAGNHMAT